MAENAVKTGGRSTTRATKSRRKMVPAAAEEKVEAEKVEETGFVAKSSELMELLPAPEDLAKYEKVVPGGAERIIELAERQARHARRVESEELAAAVRTTRIRQIMIFVLAAAAGMLGGALLLDGSELAGLIIILVDVVALVGVTIYGKSGGE